MPNVHDVTQCSASFPRWQPGEKSLEVVRRLVAPRRESLCAYGDADAFAFRLLDADVRLGVCHGTEWCVRPFAVVNLSMRRRISHSLW